MRSALIIVTLLLTVCALSGCATVFGTALYGYENGDCKVTVASRRDVGGPVEVQVDKDCTLTAKTGSLQGGGLTPTETALLGRALDIVAPVPVKLEPEQ